MQSNTDNTKWQDSIKDGALRELEATKLFIQRGYTVSVPTMSTRYDFIAEKYPVMIRVQVKNLNLKKPRTENKLSHDIWYIKAFSNPNKTKLPYSRDDCDVIVGISLKPRAFAIVPIEELANRTTPYRLSEHEKNKGRDYLNSFFVLDN